MTIVTRGRSFQATVTYKGKRYRRQFVTEHEAQTWELEAKAALERGELPTLGAKAAIRAQGKSSTKREPLSLTTARHWNDEPATERTDAATRAGPLGKEIHSLMKVIDAIWGDDGDMPVQQARAFLAVAMCPGLTMGQLSTMLFMSQGACSKNVAALSKWQSLSSPGLDLIEAIEDPRERRRKILYLTSKGRRHIARALEALTGALIRYDAPSAAEAWKR